MKKGDSYKTFSPMKSCPPAIFGYFGDINGYDTTWDDDIWEIDTKKFPTSYGLKIIVQRERLL